MGMLGIFLTHQTWQNYTFLENLNYTKHGNAVSQSRDAENLNPVIVMLDGNVEPYIPYAKP